MAELSRWELAADLVLLTALGGGALALAAGWAWAFFTRPDERGRAVAAVAFALTLFCFLAVVWAGRLTEWRRRTRAESGGAADGGGRIGSARV